jgi:hypothetical protein
MHFSINIRVENKAYAQEKEINEITLGKRKEQILLFQKN